MSTAKQFSPHVEGFFALSDGRLEKFEVVGWQRGMFFDSRECAEAVAGDIISAISAREFRSVTVPDDAVNLVFWLSVTPRGDTEPPFCMGPDPVAPLLQVAA